MRVTPKTIFISKEQAYQAALQTLAAVLENEHNFIMKMATINCILKENLPYCFWVGFYCMNKGQLTIGPYQGTLGCLHIALDKGICGRAARTGKTQIVDNVHADPAHLACDSRTNSEIVVPVYNQTGKLLAVLDLDSTEKAAFDAIDQQFLETLVKKHFAQAPLEMAYQMV